MLCFGNNHTNGTLQMKILGLPRSLGQLLLISIGPGPHFMGKSWGEYKSRLLETEQHAKRLFNFILNMVTLPYEKAAPFIAFRKPAGIPAPTDCLHAWYNRLAEKLLLFSGQILQVGSSPHLTSVPWSSVECRAWEVQKDAPVYSSPSQLL